MNSNVISYLNKRGFKIPATDFYEYIEMWKEWYDNDVNFHNYKDNYGQEKKMYSLGMAKRMCEDWASVIVSEKDEIITDNEKNNKYIKELIKKTNLKDELPKIVEIASWSGTCARIYRLKNIEVKNGMIVKTKDTKVDAIIVPADKIIPLRIEHGRIIDVAFTSESTINDKKVIYIEIHQLKEEGYEISNIYIDSKTGKEIVNTNTIASYNTNSNIPLFAILEPPTYNSIKNNIGLGLSIYANAIDQLKATDITYHNFIMDFVLGGKKIIYNKKLIKYKQIKVRENGKEEIKEVPIYPDDISKQQFMEVGDIASENEDTLIHEYNPELRVSENKEGIQFALDVLAFMCSLGAKYYQFNNGAVVTATQYAGDRQDLMKNANKYRNNLDKFVTDTIRAGLLIARVVLGENVTEECEVKIENKDGILVSDEEVNEKYRQEYNMGLISKKTYLMKANNWTEERALQELQAIEEENQIKEIKLGEE